MANNDLMYYGSGFEFQSTFLTIDEVENRIRHLLEENSNLRNTLKQNNTYMEQLSVSLIKWQDEVAQTQKSYYDKFEKARDLVQKLKKENVELKIKLQSQPASLNESQVMSNTTQQEIQDSIPSSIIPESLNSFAVIEREPDQDFCVIQHEINNETEKSNPKEQITANQNQTEHEKDTENSMKIATLQEVNEKLMENIRELQEKMDLSDARLAKAEELVLRKQSRNTELEINVSLLEKTIETLPLLNAQIELYKNDFEAERDARQNLAGEKETMAQEIRLLRRKLETRPLAAPAAANVLDEENENTYECPKCSFAYSSMDSLNNHLDVCLNQQMFP